MGAKWLPAVAGVLLLAGCLVGISFLVFQEEAPKTPYTIRTEEPFKAREPGERAMGGTQLHGTLKSELELNMLADELDKLFSKTQSRGIGSVSTPSKRNSTQRVSSSTLPTSTPPRLSSTVRSLTSASTRKVDEANTGGPHGWKDEAFQVGPHLSRRVFPTAGLEPLLVIRDEDRVGGGTLSGDEQPGWEDPEMLESETSEEDQYVSDVDEEAGDVMELDSLFDLASNLYASGVNTSDFQGFLRVINETINRGNESGLLSQLNELYSRPEIASALGSTDLGVGRNAYESSLTAFVFMSFGVFLLNQIHALMGKDGHAGSSEGRQFQLNSLEDSELNVLFQPPGDDETEKLKAVSGSRDALAGEVTGQKYVNNMFRALLNLVNAYTKDSDVLECIWSLYCEDLDKTSANDGLYGIAARINSIGLRLIMHQISAELTMDVMLRSLLGWDGLPCTKMFPKCQVENATATLRAATSGNSPSSLTRLPI